MNATLILALLVCVLLLLVFRFILRTPKNRAKVGPNRLTRIQNASLVISILLWISVILSAYSCLSFIFGWPSLIRDHIRIVTSPNHIYSSPSEMPPTIFWLTVVKQGWAFFAAGAMLRLFWLYGKGILFTAKNVNCLRFLGYYCIVDWFIDYQIEGFLHDMDLSSTRIFVGFFIIFFAWIMDEGRKIQEEQALTV
jgi:hypothetical protein